MKDELTKLLQHLNAERNADEARKILKDNLPLVRMKIAALSPYNTACSKEDKQTICDQLDKIYIDLTNLLLKEMDLLEELREAIA